MAQKALPVTVSKAFVIKGAELYVSRLQVGQTYYTLSKQPSIFVTWNEGIHDRIYDDLRDRFPGLTLHVLECYVVQTDKICGEVKLPCESPEPN